MLHFLFPAFGPETTLLAPELLADKKRMSAELAAGILAIIIDAHRDRKLPLYVVIVDAKEAYDNVWRDALWAKVAVAHGCLEDVRRARALYEHMDAQIVEEGFESTTVYLPQGVPQGGPRSGKLFGLFNSDLPEELRKVGAGTRIGEVDLTCITFLDDSMIPSASQDITRGILTTLVNYGDRWSQQWAPAKSKVLCLNVSSPPAQWLFKGHWIDSVIACKYLGVHFDPTRGWSTHFAMKRTAALLVRLELSRAGLFGGRNAPADSLEVVRAMVWPVIDYGRGVASSQGPKCKGVAKSLDTFQLETLREILGVSKRCRVAGVRGELGEIPDLWRERKRQLLTARQMLRSPRGSLMEQIARQANRASPKLGIFRIVHKFLAETNGPPLEEFRNKSDIKRWILTTASREWKAKVDQSPCLSRTYIHSNSLGCKGYLRRAFPGRCILTRLRLDDLELGAASYRGKINPLPMCAMCGDEAETREHFVLRCRPLSGVREANIQTMKLAPTSPDPDSALDVLTLATPRGAEDDISRAIKVGKLLHELWTLRAKLLDIRVTLD